MSEEEVDQLATSEVLDEARDVVAGLELRLQQVRAGVLDGATAAKLLAQDAASLRLKARSVTIAGLGPLTHRLDDYAADIQTIEAEHVEDLQAFSDKISDLLDGTPTGQQDVAAVVRDLPRKKTFDISDITITNTEVTLVVPQRTAAKVVERELAACGYRVSTVNDPLEAIGLVMETKPDLVITAMVMPRMSGVDLACALAAMPATRDIPVAVLTSMDAEHPDLKPLPMSVGLIRRGDSFGDDLADVLQRFKIT